jgi:hypothetical protein
LAKKKKPPKPPKHWPTSPKLDRRRMSREQKLAQMGFEIKDTLCHMSLELKALNERVTHMWQEFDCFNWHKEEGGADDDH